jgi:hypothetical protein
MTIIRHSGARAQRANPESITTTGSVDSGSALRASRNDKSRREFIAGLGGAAASSVSWPLAARSQQGERVRRVGMLLPAAADDPEFQARLSAFLQALALLGWTIGRNVRIDTRWATTNAAEIRRHAAELARSRPTSF